MPGKLVKTPYDHLTYGIIGSAMAIHRAQGSGKREGDYQRAPILASAWPTCGTSLAIWTGRTSACTACLQTWLPI
jgi:hypothetical protein